jgi:ubiquinone/menaquinone biosynthesis C-methylase UbiE
MVKPLTSLCVVLVALLASGCAERPQQREIDLIVATLELGRGMTVADVGAGNGAFTRALARRVGPDGQVYASELGADSVAKLRAALAGLGNVAVVEATATTTGLPDACCDGILLRGVYHHLTRPNETLEGLKRALKPGGRLLVVDFPPSIWLKPWTPQGLPANRHGQGVESDVVVTEASAAGFEEVRLIEDWPTGWFTDLYGLLLRPESEGSADAAR